jgi:hypothetical protein
MQCQIMSVNCVAFKPNKTYFGEEMIKSFEECVNKQHVLADGLYKFETDNRYYERCIGYGCRHNLVIYSKKYAGAQGATCF